MLSLPFPLLVCLLVISLVYLGAAAQKLLRRPPMPARMAEMRFGGWRMAAIGWLEVLGVVGLWLPPTRSMALLSLLPYAVSGWVLHLAFGHGLRERQLPALLMMVAIPLALYLDPDFRVIFHR